MVKYDPNLAVDAVKFTDDEGGELSDVQAICPDAELRVISDERDDELVIPTKAGSAVVLLGEWVVKLPDGEFIVIDDDTFTAAYTAQPEE